MNPFKFFPLICGMAFISSITATAQESKTRLPDDGWRVTYSIRHTATVSSGKVVKDQTKKRTIAFVGTITEGDEVYRWVEVKFIEVISGTESTVLLKLLIAEKDLLESEDPFNKIRRGWHQRINGEIQVYKVPARQAFDNSNFFFPGTWRNAGKILEERTVDYQQGRLKIPKAETLHITQLELIDQPGWTEVSDYTRWSDPTTSPLISALRIQAKYHLNGKLNTTHDEDIELQNYGTDAKSELPGKN